MELYKATFPCQQLCTLRRNFPDPKSDGQLELRWYDREGAPPSRVKVTRREGQDTHRL